MDLLIPCCLGFPIATPDCFAHYPLSERRISNMG